MVEEAFKNINNYLETFKEIEEIYHLKEQTFKTIIAELESKYGYLLEQPKKQDEFLIPEIPKFKKEVKDKRESSRAPRRNQSDLHKTIVVQRESSILNDSEIIRRSSRIASKTKLKPSISTAQNTSKLETGVQNSTYLLSPSHPPIKLRRTNDGNPKKSDERPSQLEESVCTTDMKQPLGSSTPTSPPLCTPPKEKASDKEKKTTRSSDEENKTPTNTIPRAIKGESVKKRVEEFEKRVKDQLPSKLPVKTPEKTKVILTSKIDSKINNSKKDTTTDDESSIAEPRMLRGNSKILQEKNPNVKLSKEKALEAQKKKAALMKASMEENKRKREERGRKVAAQREAAEKEKLMKLEKQKEEKLKLIQKMKDEQLKGKYEKKKLPEPIAALKVAEVKKPEDLVRLAIAKSKKVQLLQAQAVKEEVPQYGIDNVLEGDSSEDEDNPKRQIPSWATKKMRDYPLNVQAWLNKKKTVYPWFYNKNLKYPKLEELFSVEVKARPRTSSAFWNSRICFNESFPIV